MSTCIMKQKVAGTEKCVMKPSIAAVSLQEELVAAIHGAFEVAVEIAVREVKKLVNQTTNDTYEELRRENESLKRRLQRAEAELDCARLEENHDTPQSKSQPFTDTDQPPHPHCNQMASYAEVSPMHSCTEVRGDTPDSQNEHTMSRNEEQNSSQGHDAASHAKTGQSKGCDTKDATKKIPNACVLKGEGLNPSCRDPGSRDCDSPPFPSNSTMKKINVKQENLEEARDSSSCCLESIKLEEFSLDCMSAVQSKMLEEWKPEVPDIQSQDPNFQLSSAEFEQADSPDPTTSIPLPSDVQSLSAEFPSIFQVAEPAPVSEPPPQAFGVNVRGSRSLNNPSYICKNCGQGFHLPSLLRRHYGQCQQRFQYRSQQPMAGGKRTRLQLYPPGCSPFCCTVCNREFNRLENLKTHLRIHTGERPYTCAVCAKCFRHSGALTRHFRIHTGEKPYVCDQCGKSFRNCGGLKFHQRSHNKQLQ